MIFPTLDTLPAAPSEKEGWPWTGGSLPVSAGDLAVYPKISIITPNYNRAAFLEKTIRSVLLQNYPNLEYIIIDGGSTDGSVEVIEKYQKYLAYWVSEPDENQPDAINKGLRQCTGDIIAYINSDDYYLPGTLHKIVYFLEKNPDCGWLSGVVRHEDINGRFLFRRRIPPVPEKRSDWIDRWPTYQPACFWRYTCFQKVGKFRTDLIYVFDTEFTIRLLFHECFPLLVDEELAVRVLHEDAKQVSDSELFPLEAERFYQDYERYLTMEELPPFFWRQIRRKYGRKRKESIPRAYLYVASQALRYPLLFYKGMRWWEREQAH